MSRKLSAFLIAALLHVTIGLGLNILIASTAYAGDLQQSHDQEQNRAQLWRVSFADSRDLQDLSTVLDIWQVDHAAGFVVAPLTKPEVEDLRRRQHQVAQDFVQTEDLARAIDRMRLPVFSASAESHIPGFTCYRTVEQTVSDLQALADSRPDLASWIDIGDSWDKSRVGGPSGYDLHAIVLTNRLKNAPKFKFLLIAAVHARELATAETATRFAEHLVANYGIEPDITWLLDYAEIHIVSVANPDGRTFAEQGLLWRKNTNNDACTGTEPFPGLYGVDLNRNSSFRWNACDGFGCSSSDPCSITYRGVSPSSEPETVALQTYAQTIFPDQRVVDISASAPITTTGLFVSLHSYGGLVLYPWGWTGRPTANDDALAELARKLGSRLGYRACQAGESGCLYQTDGTNDDWIYGELGVAAYTFELGSAFFESCQMFEDSILDNTIAALIYAFKSARLPYASAAAPDITWVSASPAVVNPGMAVTVTGGVDVQSYDVASREGLSNTHELVRYSVGAPSWSLGAETISVGSEFTPTASANVTFAASINTAGWDTGRHTVFVEALGDDQQPGVPKALFVDVVDELIQFEAGPKILTGEAQPGDLIRYTAIITNSGAARDSYTATVLSADWPTVPEMGTVALDPLGTAKLNIEMSIPSNARPGTAGKAAVHITSFADPRLNQELELRAEVSKWRYLFPLVFVP